MRFSLKIFAVVSLAILLVACGKDDDSGPSYTAPISTMEGNWAKTCETEVGSTGSQLETLSVENISFRSNYTFFSDSGCKTPSYEMRASFEILSSTGKTSNLADVYDLDISLSRIVITPLSEEIVAAFNSEKAYGISNWTVNGATSVTGKTIEGTDDPQTVIGSKYFDIFKVSGGTLNFGDSETGDGDTAAARPKTLEAKAFNKL
jgi:hypothetical protein